MTGLRELDIVVADSKKNEIPGHPELPPKAFSGTWSWRWYDDGSGYEERGDYWEGEEDEERVEGDDGGEGEEEKEARMKNWGKCFFTYRPESSSQVPSVDEIVRDPLYQVASLEPFAHWFDPEQD